MSVIQFPLNHFEKVESLLIGNPYVLQFLNTLPEYNDFKDYYSKIDKKIVSMEKYYIGALMWYSYVANKVAYSLQYKEPADFFNEQQNQETETEPIPNNDFKLIREELGSIHYNIYTNGGNVFLGPDWLNPLKAIIEFCESIANGKIREIKIPVTNISLNGQFKKTESNVIALSKAVKKEAEDFEIKEGKDDKIIFANKYCVISYDPIEMDFSGSDLTDHYNEPRFFNKTRRSHKKAFENLKDNFNGTTKFSDAISILTEKGIRIHSYCAMD